MIEARRMFETGAPLGEVMRLCYGDLALHMGKPLTFGLYDVETGADADHGIEAIMRGGAANRILYGDPAFDPFEKLDLEATKASKSDARDDGTFEVACKILDTDAPYFTNLFDGRQLRARLIFSVPLTDEEFSSGVKDVVSVKKGDADDLVHAVKWAVESHHGTKTLHILAASKKPRLVRKDGRYLRQTTIGTEKGQTFHFLVTPKTKTGSAGDEGF
jgi:hypothetical protein